MCLTQPLPVDTRVGNGVAKADEILSISSVLKKVQKDYGLRVGSLSAVADDVEAIPSGNIAIDDITGVGGLPLGRSVELYGQPSSGKTTTALQAAANLQRKIIAEGLEEYILYSDFEHALDKTYACSLGLDLDHPSFLFCQPDNFEQGAQSAVELIRTGSVRLGIWDSVAAMTPADMLTADVGKASVALQARLMSDFMKKLNPLLDEKNCCAVFLNHIQDVISIGGFQPPGPPRTTTPGGKALKFYASVRMEYQQVKNITAAMVDQLTGAEVKRVEATNVRVRVVKNKVGPPFREAVVRVRFGRGFDDFWSALQILVGRGQVVCTTGYYYFDKMSDLIHEDMAHSKTGRPLIHGEDAVLSFADEHPVWRATAIASARKLIAQGTKPGELSQVQSDVPPEVTVQPKPNGNGKVSSIRTVDVNSLINPTADLFKVGSETDG